MHQKNGILLAEILRHGYTIESFAAAVGVHYLTMWRIVNDQHSPRRATAQKICELLGKEPHQLGFEVWGGGKKRCARKH